MTHHEDLTLTEAVDEMAHDLDLCAELTGADLSYTGDELRAHYRRVVDEHGTAAATADAQHRYRVQVECQDPSELPSLSYPTEVRTDEPLPLDAQPIPQHPKPTQKRTA